MKTARKSFGRRHHSVGICRNVPAAAAGGARGTRGAAQRGGLRHKAFAREATGSSPVRTGRCCCSDSGLAVRAISGRVHIEALLDVSAASQGQRSCQGWKGTSGPRQPSPCSRREGGGLRPPNPAPAILFACPWARHCPPFPAVKWTRSLSSPPSWCMLFGAAQREEPAQEWWRDLLCITAV